MTKEPQLATAVAARDEYHLRIERPQRGIRLSQYVYEIGSYHYNWHSELELLVALRGEMEVAAGGSITSLQPGDVVSINSGISHATLSQGDGSLALLLKLDLCWFADLFEDHSRVRFDIASDEETRGLPVFVEIRALMARMMLDGTDTSPADLVRHERLLAQLLDLLVSHFPPHLEGHVAVQGNESRNRAIDQLLAYIDRHYAERITLERLGAESGYNPSYVSQLFTRHLGVSTLDYITRVRLRQAARDLCDPAMKVVDVAASNGFADVKAFNVAFRKSFGKSPTQYRAQLTEQSLAVDARFKQIFARRDDRELAELLRRWAAPLEEEAGGLAVPALPTDEARRLLSDARHLVDGLQGLEARLGQVASGLA
ncbi:helix-turn-helix protein [Luteococcus japonicus]|uniref:Helix-turn-helix protein n=1 Tax=Luteococcus japonicus TaxID=33984 RepID=A0A3N1ZVQ3_9ACTN|nr:AraC family transcriptional regulator [Luteococcus japonicus]ROR54924.1 helix-turn-helix protein [Luteococcus japonicus]